jgi:hypothetical protein
VSVFRHTGRLAGTVPPQASSAGSLFVPHRWVGVGSWLAAGGSQLTLSDRGGAGNYQLGRARNPDFVEERNVEYIDIAELNPAILNIETISRPHMVLSTPLQPTPLCTIIRIKHRIWYRTVWGVLTGHGRWPAGDRGVAARSV